ncbi:MAG: hypothetical protein FVQ81_05625 [Candidatus Glassbacteria bacterium]|nr:hypothetical protein [Candidatus Glassbacteria bacterium]
MRDSAGNFLPAMESICGEHLSLHDDEVLLIVADPSRKALAGKMARAAETAGYGCNLIVIGEVVRAGQAPAGFTEELLAGFPAALLVTGKSLSHTDERRKACREQNTRIASMPGLTDDILLHLFRPGSADVVRRRTVEMVERVKDSRRVRVRGPAGTRMELSVQDRKLYLDTGLYRRPGDFGNLPAGEVAWSPVPGSASGRIVVDVAFAGLRGVNGLKLTIEDGAIVDAEGAKARELMQVLAGKPERVLGEFGIGTNPLARPGAVTLEAEKAVGTVHFGFGDSRSFGGTNQASGHWDCVVRADSLDIDSRAVELAP